MLRVSENELEQFAQSCVLSWKSVCLPTEGKWPPAGGRVGGLHNLVGDCKVQSPVDSMKFHSIYDVDHHSAPYYDGA